MAERKAMSKKTRFDVFKRDRFQCQYCGRTAPDVTLEVDHIKPVVDGGDNGMLNLITSCFDCNRGKGKRKLSDSESLKKEYKQIADLSERREQIEMMMDWKNLEIQHSKSEFDLYENLLISDYDFYIKDQSDKVIYQCKRALKKYGYDLFVEMTEKTAEKHFNGNYGSINQYYFIQDVRTACYWEKSKKDNPQKHYIPYISAILENRFSQFTTKKGKVLNMDKSLYKYIIEKGNLENKKDVFEELVSFVKSIDDIYDFFRKVGVVYKGDKK